MTETRNQPPLGPGEGEGANIVTLSRDDIARARIERGTALDAQLCCAHAPFGGDPALGIPAPGGRADGDEGAPAQTGKNADPSGQTTRARAAHHARG